MAQNSDLTPKPPKYHRWAAEVALSKKDYRDYYYNHYGCLNFCKPSLGSAPTVTVLTIILTSILFFVSADQYLYFNTESPLDEKEFFIFTTNNKWYLNLLTFLTSFFNATEMQMYISNLLVLFFIGVPLEMVHGSVTIVKLFTVSFLSQIFTSFFFSTGCNFMIIGASSAIQALIYAHMFTITLSWSRLEKPSAILRLTILAFWLIQDNTWQLYRYYASINSSHPFSPVTMVLSPIIGATYGVVLLYSFRGNDNDKHNDQIKVRNIKEWSCFGGILVGSLVFFVLGLVFR